MCYEVAGFIFTLLSPRDPDIKISKDMNSLVFLKRHIIVNPYLLCHGKYIMPSKYATYLEIEMEKKILASKMLKRFFFDDI